MQNQKSIPNTSAALTQVEQRIRKYLDSRDALLFSVQEAVKLTGLSKNTLWAAIATGDLVHLRWGRRVLIDPDDLVTWLHQHRMRGPHDA